MERALLETVKLFGVTGLFEDQTAQTFFKNLDFSKNDDGSEAHQLLFKSFLRAPRYEFLPH